MGRERGTGIFHMPWYNAVKVKAVLFCLRVLYLYRNGFFSSFPNARQVIAHLSKFKNFIYKSRADH